MKPPYQLPDPTAEDYRWQAVDWMRQITEALDGRVSFGNPQDPGPDVTSTALAGVAATSHPGTLDNIEGTWVEVDVAALDTAVPCYHNLNLSVPVAGEPNVRWQTFGIMHSGVGTDTGTVAATATVSVNFDENDSGTVAANSISLRFYAEATRTVDGDNPLKVSLFFTPAVRRP